VRPPVLMPELAATHAHHHEGDGEHKGWDE
jgi:hypothetical protein